MLPTNIYIANNSPQIQGAISVLKHFKSKMKLSENQKIADIGCGLGDISHDYLLPLIRSDGQLVGIDKSSSMIDHAKNYYADPRSSFQVFDITKSEIVDKFESYFDSVFSFYCLNWVRDHRTAMENIHSILKPGGETLLTWVIDSVVYTLFETLAASPKWSLYMPDYKEAISLLRYSSDPVSEATNLMQDVGFQVEECFVHMGYHTFPSKEHFYKWLDSLNPFTKNIPDHLLKEFNEELKKILWDKRIFLSPTLNEHKNIEVIYKYLAISVLARK